ncbi:alcohol dehydrogenase catalytic domain-containing protein, partial [Pseudomonas aeruginosa]
VADAQSLHARAERGDRVAVEPEYRCGECRYCREGRYNLCESMGFIGLMGDGGFAERARVPAYMLHRLPDAVGFRQAAAAQRVQGHGGRFEHGGLAEAHRVRQ